MNVNAGLFVMAIWFAALIWFAKAKIWPPLMTAIGDRQKKIAAGFIQPV